MQRILISGFMLLLSLHANSQAALETNVIYGGNSIDEAKDLGINASQTVLFLGSRSFSSDGDVPENSGGSDFWIMKQEINGTLLWSRVYGGVGNDDLEAIMPHPDGGVMAFGTTRTDQGAFGEINGLAGGWLMRTNNNGTIVAGKIFGGSITETAVDAYRHVSGDIIMAMESGSPTLNGQTNNGILDVWIVNTDAALTTQWTSLLGGSGTDVPESITGDINGNIYVAATSNSNLPGLPMNKGGKDMWIIKIGPDGETLWQKNFGGSADDEASDIIVNEDGFGSVFVFGHSASADHDFGINHGLNDLWMIKLDAQDGATQGIFHFGGSGNDFDGHADFYGNDQLVITATTTSKDFDLTGSKGLSDVWVFNTDLDGNITYQMNYGGSLNDQAVDIITIDSTFHLLSRSLSSDKNVPQNLIAQQDLWYYTLNPNPDTCSEQFLCLPDSMLTNHLYPPANDALICVSGCTSGYGPGPSFTNMSCPDFDHATAYFFVTTDTTADLLTLSVNSDEFNQPQIALLKSVNCTTFVKVECNTGAEGAVLLQFIDIEPMTTYVVAISDAEGNIGTFELCATSVDVEFCNEVDKIYVTETSMNSPLEGPFQPGEEVHICYELTDWSKLDCNGIQGIVPTFGPGWDPSSFHENGQPLIVDTLLAPATTGFWTWYELGDVRYNISNPINGYQGGQGMPPGWYFTNTADPPPADKPDQTTGDINNCLPTSDSWKVCFTLQVVEECEANLDCSVSVKTFSDGEVGIDPSLACAYDQEEVLTVGMVCCINPAIDVIQNFSVCSGDTISFKPETNLLPPVTYSWTVNPDPFIVGATSANNAANFYQVLTTEAVIPLKVRYSMTAASDGCQTEAENFDVTVLPLPTSRLTVTGPTIVCSGSTVTFNFESTGTPPFAIGLYRDNEFFANVLSESNFLSIDIDPIFSGRFKIGTLKDASCEGLGTGFVNVTVKPINTALIDTVICDGESFFIGDEEYTETGHYSVTLENGAENNCDSIVMLNLVVAPTVVQPVDEVICNGDTIFVLEVPYTETIDTLIEYTGPEGCPNYIDFHLLVKDTFTMEFDQTICFGDSLEIGGIKIYQEGDYVFVEEIRPGCFEQTTVHLDVLPAIVINDLAIIGDNGSNTGAILVEIIGGSPPFTYLWNTGQTTESLFNIMHGDYSLTVTDRLGCAEFFGFEVPMISSSSEVASARETITLSPTITHSGEYLKLMNTGKTVVQMEGVTWWAMNGKWIRSGEKSNIESGNSFLLKVPEALAPGLYQVLVQLSNGQHTGAKILVQD